MVRPDTGKPWLLLSHTRHNQMGNSKVSGIWKDYFHPQYEYGDSLDDYVHPYFEDIRERYLEEIYKFGL